MFPNKTGVPVVRYFAKNMALLWCLPEKRVDEWKPPSNKNYSGNKNTSILFVNVDRIQHIR